MATTLGAGNVNISAPITVDSASPMIGYYKVPTGGWTTAHGDDGALPKYFDSTFTSSITQDDYLSFDFQGTGIAAFGALRPNHGYFRAFVDTDSAPNSAYNDASSSPDDANSIFQANIYKTNVAAGQHTLWMINQPQTRGVNQTTFFDIDYFIIDTGVVGKIYTTKFDISSNAYTLSTGQWSQNGTEQQCVANGCAASIKFNGSSIAVYGSLDTNHGNYTVQVDNSVNTMNLNGQYTSLVNDTMLFLAQGLSEHQEHTILFRNIIDGSALSLDYAIVNSTLAQPGQNATGVTFSQSMGAGSSLGGNTTAVNGSSNADSKKHTNAGAIAGGVVGGVLGLLVIAGLLWFFFWRKRKQGKKDLTRYDSLDLNGEPNHPLDGGEVQPFQAGSNRSTFGSPTSRGYSTVHTSAPSMSQSGGPGQSFLSSVPPPPASNTTSYLSSPVTVNNSSRYNTQPFGSYSAFGSGPSVSGASNSNSNSNSHTNSSDRSPIMGGSAALLTPQNALQESGGVAGRKAAYAPLPYTSQRTNLSAANVGERFAVDGRDVDMGPAHAEEMLPPDYRQATQPLPGQGPPRSPP